jgi:succinoglycan biosynthesis protein ExoM
MAFMIEGLKREHITVCICTFRRSKMLEKLLQALDRQISNDQFTFSVVVVDNDASRSAESTVVCHQQNSDIVLEYFLEPEQNIALARNRTIENAQGNYLAFIDDDEFPPKDWLFKLYKTLREHEADGVLGPVKAFFENEPPTWVAKGKFYEKEPPFCTGRVLKWAETRTSNALLKKDVFVLQENRFLAELGRGGEDKEFFRRMIKKGNVFVWCSEAFVYETIPPGRCTRTFMVKRALLRGKMSLIDETFGVVSILKSFAAIPLYTLVLPFLFLTRHDIVMKYVVKESEHIGKILALFGLDVVKQKYVIH